MKKLLSVLLICFITVLGIYIHLYLFSLITRLYEMGNSGVLAPWSASSLGYIFQCGLFGGIEFFLLSLHSLRNIFSDGRSGALKQIFAFFKLSILYIVILFTILLIFGLLSMLKTDNQYVWELPILPIIVLLNIITAAYVFSKMLSKYYERKANISL